MLEYIIKYCKLLQMTIYSSLSDAMQSLSLILWLSSLQIMIVNNTCVPGNGTDACPGPGSSAGLAVGLTFFFLLLVIVATVMAYKYRGEIRNIWSQFEQRRSQGKEDYTQTPQASSHEYTSMITDQSAGQTPIYENLATQTTGYNRRSVQQNR